MALIGVLNLAIAGGVSLGLLAHSAVSGAIVGFVSGLVFSAAFSAINHDRELADVRLGQSTLVGAGAGLLFPAAFVGLALTAGFGTPWMTALVNMSIGAGLGGSTAHGLVRIARSGEQSLGGGDAGRVESGG